MNCIYSEGTDASCAADNSRLLIAMKCTEREKGKQRGRVELRASDKNPSRRTRRQIVIRL